MRGTLRGIGVVLGALLAVMVGLAWALAALGSDIASLRWERPWWLLVLVAVPPALLVGTILEDRRIPRLRFGSIAAATLAPVGLRQRLRDAPGVLRAASIALFAIALARPQSQLQAVVEERRGIDIMIALDLSGSMRAADLKPTRLAAAQGVVQEFIERRGDDRIGAVVFAREAFLLVPPTFDKQLLGKMIGKMKIGMEGVSGDGTAIGEGLGSALARLRRSNASSRVIILLTDGDNNSGRMSPETAMELAKKLGVKIYTVQMGNGDEVDVEVKRDMYNRPVYARASFPVNPELLKRIAKETGGEMYIANQTEELRSSMHAILDNLQKTAFEAPAGDIVERYPMALVPGALLVILEAILRAILLRRFP
jgi:Ca-activated chloride channel family protein